MPNTNKAVDITNLTDAVLDAVLDVRSGADFVDASNLTVAERYAAAEALGWEMNARTRNWCENPSYEVKTNRKYTSVDVEGMILAEQEQADFGEDT